jgi:photosystem II stability/assembly factor-like uncharacterized protein
MRWQSRWLPLLTLLLIAGRDPMAWRPTPWPGDREDAAGFWSARERGPVGTAAIAWARGQRSARADGADGSYRWTSLGPAPIQTSGTLGNNTGRITAIAISPADPRLILAGASSGGIWRSTNGGDTFAPVIDDLPDLTVGAIAFSPSNPNVAYAGMGDDHLGIGVLKSTDAGATWRLVSGPSYPARSSTRKIAVDPANDDVVWLLQSKVLSSAGASAPSGALMKSVDDGATWTAAFTGLVSDFLIPSPDGATLLLGAVRGAHFGTGGIYRTADGGKSWTLMYSNSDPDTPPAYYLAAGASGTLFAAAIESANEQTQYRLLSSSDGGQQWSQRGTLPSDFRSTYLTVLGAGGDDRTLYWGAVNAYRSTDGGVTWIFVSTHPDQRALAFEPGNPSHVWLGNDGGLFRSVDGGATYESLASRLPVVQFYSVNAHPTDPKVLFGGSQDNGLQVRAADGTAWSETLGSDIGAQVFDPHDPARLLTTTYAGTLIRCSSLCRSSVETVATLATFGEPNINSRVAFIPPLAEGADGTVWFATWRLFSSKDFGTSWTAPAGTTDLTAGGTDVITSVGVARSDAQVLYTGSGKGHVMLTRDGGSSWTDVTPPVGLAVTSIAVDRSSAATATISFGGYGGARVCRTTNFGASWTDLSDGLPSVPVDALYIDGTHQDRLLAGTDAGVFRFDEAARRWSAFYDGMPSTIVTSFTATADGRLIAGTYGRGAYELMETNPPETRRRPVRH